VSGRKHQGCTRDKDIGLAMEWKHHEYALNDGINVRGMQNRDGLDSVDRLVAEAADDRLF
jgi:hypothetical protein